jgi:hypothetical protein
MILALLLAVQATIPFEIVNRHIMFNVMVGQKPLHFMFDTGDRYAIIDSERAKELDLPLSGSVPVIGNGGSISGSMVKKTSYWIEGVDGFSQPIVLAIPLASMESRLGASFDGIIGSEFISQFVVEIDYAKQLMRLHDRDTFKYEGPGESIPIRMNHSGHPILAAEVTPVGGKPIQGEYVLDLGAAHAVMLRTPVVKRLQLLADSNLKTIALVGGAGAGGSTKGRIGRVDSVRIGRFVLKRPLAVFAQDEAGEHTSDETLGSFGEEVASRFRIFLDYPHDRIILEPLPKYDAPFTRALSGVAIDAADPFKTFRVSGVAPDSPASRAGLKIGDVVNEIDHRAVSDLTLTKIVDTLGHAGTHQLLLTRGAETIRTTLESVEY